MRIYTNIKSYIFFNRILNTLPLRGRPFCYLVKPQVPFGHLRLCTLALFEDLPFTIFYRTPIMLFVCHAVPTKC